MKFSCYIYVYDSSKYITRAKYNKIEMGMTYPQVVEIIGSKGGADGLSLVFVGEAKYLCMSWFEVAVKLPKGYQGYNLAVTPPFICVLLQSGIGRQENIINRTLVPHGFPALSIGLTENYNTKNHRSWGVFIMQNETRKRFVWIIGIVMALCLCFFLCQYVFLEPYEVGEMPPALFILGLIIIVTASFFDARKVMACTPSGYMIGFVVGALFNVDGVDYGGARTNNFWLLWQNAFLLIIFIGIVWEIVSRILKWHRRNKKH